MEYKPVIGLEIHCELNTDSKMFCACPNRPGDSAPNTDVCPVCLGHPGTLPTANRQAIEKVMLAGLALNAEILPSSKFDRKNYFYPDLPKGYQISQYDQPLCLGGYLEIGSGAGRKTVRITRVHIEEDTGKLMHPQGENYSLVDFNRGGIPLMELVTEPDIENAFQARQFVEELQLILRYLKASEADMESGKMRVEVNISMGIPDTDTGETKLGTKVEIKNLNSLKAVEGSVAYEIKRQTAVLDAGQKIVQETRGWNEFDCATFSQREKEEAFDYRYFPEPDIPPIETSTEDVKRLAAKLCELPQAKRERFNREYGLEGQAIGVFIGNLGLANYFEKVMTELNNWVNEETAENVITAADTAQRAKVCSNYLTTDVKGILGNVVFSEAGFKPTPENFAEFIKLIIRREISSKIAKMVLQELVKNGGDPTDIIAQKGLAQISGETELAAAIDRVLAANAKAGEDYRAGKSNAFQFLVGKTLAETKGKANPDIVKRLLLQKLSNRA